MALDAALRALIPKPVRLRLRSLAAYPATARLTSDYRSFRGFRRLERSTTRWDAGERTIELRLRPLGGAPVRVRPESQDRWAVRDTFLGRYHLPPPEVEAGSVRTIWDLGSNIGLTVAHLAVMFPAAQIFGVEMDEDNALLCRENVRPWSDRCEIIRAAVWPAEGAVAYERQAGNELGFRVIGDSRPGRHSASALPLNTLLERTPGGTVDYVKMDIEGAEQDALRRNTEWASDARSIKVEVHAPYSVDECSEDLSALGFSTRPDDRHPACVLGIRTG